MKVPRVIFALVSLTILVSLIPAAPVWANGGGAGSHGGGGGHMGGHIGGHMFGRGTHSRGRQFRRMRHRREAFRQCLGFSAACAAQENGYGFVSSCGFWDWRCRFGIGTDASNSSLLNLRPADDSAPSETEAVARAFSRKNAEGVTILDLKTGYSVGITQYSVEGGSLHYLTTYGAQDSVALDRIDLNRTRQENLSRGTIRVPSSREYER